MSSLHVSQGQQQNQLDNVIFFLPDVVLSSVVLRVVLILKCQYITLTMNQEQLSQKDQKRSFVYLSWGKTLTYFRTIVYFSSWSAANT